MPVPVPVRKCKCGRVAVGDLCGETIRKMYRSVPWHDVPFHGARMVTRSPQPQCLNREAPCTPHRPPDSHKQPLPTLGTECTSSFCPCAACLCLVLNPELLLASGITFPSACVCVLVSVFEGERGCGIK
jgi:hypothetical protein